MARGWESKSVEAQIAAAENQAKAPSKGPPGPAKIEMLRLRESLLLTRTRVLAELRTARKEQHRRMLREKLEHLDRELAKHAGQP
jgi:hypothetical protein